MKKAFLIAIVLMVCSFQQPKTYMFHFTDVQVQQLYQALDKSESPHVIITELQQTIAQQYQEQQPKDTTHKK